MFFYSISIYAVPYNQILVVDYGQHISKYNINICEFQLNIFIRFPYDKNIPVKTRHTSAAAYWPLPLTFKKSSRSVSVQSTDARFAAI